MSHSITQLITTSTLRRRLVATALSLLLFALPASGAVQGDSGPESTGTVDINLISGLVVRITGLDDLPLGQWSGTGDLAGNDNFCIGRSGVALFGQNPYRIRAQGDGVPGDPAAFVLRNGPRTISYNAFFNDQVGTADRQPLTPGVALTGQTDFGLRQVFNILNGLNCVNLNANISVVVPETELQGASGAYTGTLTLVMLPE